MRLPFLVAAVLLAATPALAQKPPTDQQVEAARATMFQAEGSFYALAAQRLQAQLMEAATSRAAVDRYWAEYIGKASPASAAPAPDGAPPEAPVAPPKVPRGTKSP